MALVVMWVWSLVLRWAPTATLQDALVCRLGVTIVRLGPEDRRTFDVGGPAVVTINRD